MRVSGIVFCLLVLAVLLVDYMFGLGIAAFLGDFLVVFIVLGIVAGVIGVKTG